MGTAYLLDTSACSKYMQGFLSEEAANLMDEAVTLKSMMSVITRIELLSWVTGQKLLDDDLRQFISESEVMGITEEIILQTVRLRRQYKSVKLPDAIIAATAMVNNLILLSTNDSDFERIAGVKYKSLSK